MRIVLYILWSIAIDSWRQITRTWGLAPAPQGTVQFPALPPPVPGIQQFRVSQEPLPSGCNRLLHGSARGRGVGWSALGWINAMPRILEAGLTWTGRGHAPGALGFARDGGLRDLFPYLPFSVAVNRTFRIGDDGRQGAEDLLPDPLIAYLTGGIGYRV